MARFFSLVAEDLLPVFDDPTHLPVGLRMVRVVGPSASPGVVVVEFEDPNCPDAYDGRYLTPIFRSHYDSTGARTEVTILEYRVERDMPMIAAPEGSSHAR
jgi:hypothetical protein